MTKPKVIANRRVVVVGASTAGLTCLEGLLFTVHLNLTSLTLVSPEGLEPWCQQAVRAADGVPSADRDDIRLSPVDEDGPDIERMLKMGLERHVRVVRCGLPEDKTNLYGIDMNPSLGSRNIVPGWLNKRAAPPV